MDNNKNNINKNDNKTNKVKVHKVPIISSEALALAGKINSKFPVSEYEEVYELLNDFVDSLNVDEDGIITLEAFWECESCSKDENCDNNSETCDCYKSTQKEETCNCTTESIGVMLFDIDFDEESLINEINIAEKQNCHSPYLIMSKTTLFEFEKYTENEVYIEHSCEGKFLCADYITNNSDYRILIDNDLDFGIVHVR